MNRMREAGVSEAELVQLTELPSSILHERLEAAKLMEAQVKFC